MVVFSASGSSDRSTESLLEAMTRVAPPAVRKISIPFVMPFSLVVTRWLRARGDRHLVSFQRLQSCQHPALMLSQRHLHGETVLKTVSHDLL